MIMRRIFLLLALSLGLVACNKELSTPQESEVSAEVAIYGKIGFNTKTSVAPSSETSSKVLWDEGDKIGVFGFANNGGASLGANLAYTANTASESCAFTEVTSNIVYPEEGQSTFYAYYPYNASVSSISSVPAVVPSVQTYANGDNAQKMFMYASDVVEQGAAAQLGFKNLFALLEFGLKGQGITLNSMTVSPIVDENCTALAGETSIDLSDPTLGELSNTSKNITVNFEGGLALSNQQTWIPIAILPFECTGGLELVFTDNLGNEYTKQIWTSAKINSEVSGEAVVLSNNHLRQSLGNIIADMGDGVTNLSAPYGTSNCYIASQAGTDYKFLATVMGNGKATPAVTYAETDKNCAPGITPSALDPHSAKVLWQTAAGLIGNVYVSNGYIHFTTAGDAGDALTKGNAVISAYASDDCSGDIIWTWHIWLTDADLEADAQTYTLYSTYQSKSDYASPVVMDRNLGALDNRPFTESGTNESFGLYYQWGRKDPFLGPQNNAYNSNKIIPSYNSEGAGITNKFSGSNVNTTFNSGQWDIINLTGNPTQATIENAIKYPMTLIKRISSTTGNWLYSADNKNRNDLWGQPNYNPNVNDIGDKSIYDPCPAGWRVVHGFFATGFTSTGNNETEKTNWYSTNTTTATQYGLHLYIDHTNSGETSYYPCAGYYAGDGNGVINRTGTYAYYWTSAAYGSSNLNALSLSIDSGHINTKVANARAKAFPVRCMKER